MQHQPLHLNGRSHVKMRISDEYRKLNLELHQSNPKYGTSARKWVRPIANLIRHSGARTILDYGCGKGVLAASLPQFVIQEYDPAIPGKDREPDPADLVVCIDVLEHIEPVFLGAVLDHISRLILMKAFLNVSIRPAIKTLSDGRNAHLIVEPASWWKDQLCTYFEIEDWNASRPYSISALVTALPGRR